MTTVISKLLSRTWIILSCLLLFFINGFCQSGKYTKEDNQKIETVIHLLGYVAGDYPGAVKNGSILSSSEYAEMTEFTRTALQTAQQIFEIKHSANSAIVDSIGKLQRIIIKKGSHQRVAFLANEIKRNIITVTGFKVSPETWPDLTKGKELYSLNCSSCHGANGNGKGRLAKTLKPPPADFVDDSFMNRISPFLAYNTIRLGVQGTSMPGFSKLSDQQTWNIAFYIESLRYKTSHTDSTILSRLFNEATQKISLAEVATSTDPELFAKLKGEGGEAEKKLRSLRLHSTNQGQVNSLAVARQDVSEAMAFYQKGRYNDARQRALAAYLNGIEPVEAQLRANNPDFTAQLEQQMLGLRTVIDRKKSVKIVDEEISTSLSMISKADKILKDRKLTFWLAFLLSASILLREGLEAFLIIAVILALIRKTGKRRALLWIHGGWFTALLLGIAGWFFSDWILRLGGGNREMMEGLVSLFAVCILTFAGLWLHNNSHAKRWKKFVEEKIDKLIQTENMIGLGAFSFMVVFREAFESILFLQAVSLETAPKDQSSIGLGVLAALVAIAVLLILFLKFSSRIPIRPLFRYASWMITILAVILIGDGVHAMQEAGFFSVTPFAIDVRLSWLGVYPTVETILSQISLIILVTGLWFVSKWRLKSVKIYRT
jgi:high-affinity iron transporter